MRVARRHLHRLVPHDHLELVVLQKDMSEIFPWMRDLVNEVVVPLHARFPVESVLFVALE